MEEIATQVFWIGLLKIIGEENVFPPTEQLGAAVNHAVAAAHAWLGRTPLGETR